MPRLSLRREMHIRRRCDYYLKEDGPKVAKQLLGIFHSGHGVDRQQFLGTLSAQGVAGLIHNFNLIPNGQSQNT